VNNSFEDDVNVILLLGVSFMIEVKVPKRKKETERALKVGTSVHFREK
jgi:hypothetical protein